MKLISAVVSRKRVPDVGKLQVICKKSTSDLQENYKWSADKADTL